MNTINERQGMFARFGSLLGDFQWTTMEAVLDWWRARAARSAKAPSRT